MPGWVALAGGLGTVALVTSAPSTRPVNDVPMASSVNGPLAGNAAVLVAIALAPQSLSQLPDLDVAARVRPYPEQVAVPVRRHLRDQADLAAEAAGGDRQRDGLAGRDHRRGPVQDADGVVAA